MNAAARPPAPAPGSARAFLLLYTAPPRRQTLALLLALADEIGAGVRRPLDHGVAHARLAWWQDEVQRLQAGAAEHPWLRGAPPGDPAAPGLSALVHSAALDLATEQLAGQLSRQLDGALFVQCAQALAGASLTAVTAQQLGGLERLGQWLGALEVAATAGPAPAGIEAALQPALAPLAVWLAVAAAQCRRRGRDSTSRFAGFADSWIAWRAARRALQGRFRLP